MNTSPMPAAHAPLFRKPLAMALVAFGACVATLSAAAPDASAPPQRTAATSAAASLSEGVDWSRVVVAPVNTGMSIAAYER